MSAEPIGTVPPVEDQSARIAELTATIEKNGNDYNAMLGRYNQKEAEATALTAQVTELTTATSTVALKAEAGAGDNLALRAQVAALQEANTKAEQREGLVKNNAKRQAIVNAMTEAGADPILVGVHADSIIQNNTIEANENLQGGYDILYANPAGTVVPVGNYITDYMQTDVGKRLIPPKANPSLGGLGNTPGVNMRTVTADQANKMTTEELTSGNILIEG